MIEYVLASAMVTVSFTNGTKSSPWVDVGVRRMIIKAIMK